ncbi:MAG: sugar O-acetyltransferase [Clostridia bacterium]|nr:sugar O-acetyltransferase [Clostridia bacterium]
MTQYERMVAGLIYDPADEEIMNEQLPFMDELWAFNQLKPSQFAEKQAYMKRVFAECGENCYIELPFRANWGGHHLHLGNGVYANANLTLVDDGHIFVGDHVMFGPNVMMTTANHPIHAGLREKGLQYNKDIYIGENAWIGGGVMIMPGVHIGRNSIIGAGSIVTKDIPENVVAVGNPCRVLREVGARDKEYFFRDEKIDWENLEAYASKD